MTGIARLASGQQDHNAPLPNGVMAGTRLAPDEPVTLPLPRATTVIHSVEVQVLILLAIASLVGMVARRYKVPYTLALVLAGLGLSFIHLDALAGLSLTPDLLLLLFLPPLLFEAAYHLPFAEFRRNLAHILFLAVVGVLLAVGMTAALVYGGVRGLGVHLGFGWAHAFLFASVISATDPISVLALFRQLGAPRRLYQVVEGESLINDGVAVVVFAIVAAVIGLGTSHGPAPELHGAREIIVYAVVTFAKTAIGGVLVGAAIGALVSLLTRTIDDHLIEITLTTLVAWGSFLLAETLHVSGVLSTVAGGIVLGSFGSRFGMSASTRVAVRDFWQYMGFVSNSFIFLLIGLQLESGLLIADFVPVLIGFAAVLLPRAVIIYGGLPLIDRLTDPLPTKWRHVLAWGGLRGSLSMVLILGLPADFAMRSFLMNLVFGVVAISLFLQGLTMPALVRWLRIRHDAVADTIDYEIARGGSLSFRQVMHEAQHLLDKGLLDEPTHRRLAGWYGSAQESFQRDARELAGECARPERLLEGAKTLATFEREAIHHTVHTGVIRETAAAELLARLDRRIERLDRASHESESELLRVFEELYPASRPKSPVAEETAEADGRR